METVDSVPFPRKKLQEKNGWARDIAKGTSKATRWVSILTYIGFPPAAIGEIIAQEKFRKTNSDRVGLPKTLIIIGALLTLISIIFFPIQETFMNLLYSFGDRGELTPGVAYAWFAASAAGPAFIMAGVHSYINMYSIDIRERRYLDPQELTRNQENLIAENKELVESGENFAEGVIPFGPIEEDLIPYRQNRRGLMVGRDLKMIGHTVIAGGSGEGKTNFIKQFIYYLLILNQLPVYLDFKDDKDTREEMQSAAKKAGKKFLAIDFATSHNPNDFTNDVWLDFLSGAKTATAKAELIMNSLDFSTGENAQYYRNAAYEWLQIQLIALEAIGGQKALAPGEGVLDFLIETSSTSALIKRTSELKNHSHPKKREAFEHIKKMAGRKNDKDLGGLKTELQNFNIGAGHMLRPYGPNSYRVDLIEEIESGTMIYIGIPTIGSSSTGGKIGAVIISMIENLVEERNRSQAGKSRPNIYLCIDEASMLEERTALLNGLYRMGRSSGLRIVTTFQSLGAWDENTFSEMSSNASTFVFFKQSDPETAEKMSQVIPVIRALQSTSRSETTREGYSGRSVIDSNGSAQESVISRRLLRAGDELSTVPQFHAYVYAKNTELQQNPLSALPFRGLGESDDKSLTPYQVVPRLRVKPSKDENAKVDAPLVAFGEFRAAKDPSYGIGLVAPGQKVESYERNDFVTFDWSSIEEDIVPEEPFAEEAPADYFVADEPPYDPEYDAPSPADDAPTPQWGAVDESVQTAGQATSKNTNQTSSVKSKQASSNKSPMQSGGQSDKTPQQTQTKPQGKYTFD